jgi:hypothetical protein
VAQLFSDMPVLRPCRNAFVSASSSIWSLWRLQHLELVETMREGAFAILIAGVAWIGLMVAAYGVLKMVGAAIRTAIISARQGPCA